MCAFKDCHVKNGINKGDGISQVDCLSLRNPWIIIYSESECIAKSDLWMCCRTSSSIFPYGEFRVSLRRPKVSMSSRAMYNLFSSHFVRLYELHHDNTCLQGFLPGLTQNRLYIHRRYIEAWNYGFMKLICVFVFVYLKGRISYDVTQIIVFFHPPERLLNHSFRMYFWFMVRLFICANT